MNSKVLVSACMLLATGALLVGCRAGGPPPGSAAPGASAGQQERPAVVTLRGKPITLLGPALKEGDAAPAFVAVGNDMNDFRFQGGGKVWIVASVPSLDTPVCSRETRKFNEQAAALEGVSILTVSMDLPFAQKRWCAGEGIKDLTTVSDFRDRAFGGAWGVLMKETGLLARAVFVVGPDAKIKYVQIVPEVSAEPDYAAAIAAAKAAAGK
jgi:thiol peroxidase